MGRRMAGETPRDNIAGVRLNEAEARELAEKMALRGITDRATYFRTLMHEDEGLR